MRSSRLLPVSLLVVLVSAVLVLAWPSSAGSAASPGSPADLEQVEPHAPGTDGVAPVRRVVDGDMVIDIVDDVAVELPESLGEAGHEGHGHEGHEHAAPAPESGLHAAADGDGDGVPHFAPAAGGYALFSDSARWLSSGYTIRLAGNDRRIEELRGQLVAAARAAEAITGLPVRVAKGTGGSVNPARGEIVAVLGVGPCGAAASGCGGPTLSRHELQNGRVWIHPRALGLPAARRANLTAHELGHALGLYHYDAAWTDGPQVMHSLSSDVQTFRAGDAAGLRHAAGANDRPAGVLTSVAYAAGRAHVTGTLASGSRVRISAASASVEAPGRGGGFSGALPLPAGSHEICATSLDAAAGHQRRLGCARLEAPGRPLGTFEGATGSYETIRVRGWAVDPQTAAAVTVEVRRNGAVVARTTAAANRPDLPADIRAHYGTGHGYELDVPAVAGPNKVCVRVVGVGHGGDLDQGCRDLNHRVDPIGMLDAATVDGTTVRVLGWAIDPNTPHPVTVRVDLDGAVPALPGSFTASTTRPDVAAAHPRHGANHGFDQRLTLPPGSHRLCLTVVNVGLGSDQPIGCRKVEIRPVSAISTLEGSTAVETVIDQAGQVLDVVNALPGLGRNG